MTWIPKRRGWYKKYQGKLYTVSARQLGCPETKEGSYAAANRWWEEKQLEIDRPRKELLEAIAQESETLLTEELEQSLSESFQEILLGLLYDGAQRELLEKVIPRLQAVQGRIENALPARTPEKTVEKHVNDFLIGEKLRVDANQIDLTRYDAYRRDILIFQEWFGSQRSIEEINEDTVESYYDFLLNKVGAREQGGKKAGISPVYAQNIFGTFKMFVTRLAERTLIPLPANLLSNRFRFRKPQKPPEQFTLDEIRALLDGCDDRAEKTKLYLLLMLNAGMYQSDISELRNEEIDWDEGTVTRHRSKTKERSQIKVTYKLWPETLALLRKHRAKQGHLVLLTKAGKPLVQQRIKDEGNMSRTDNIKSAYVRLCKRIKVATKPLKNLRKTASNLLGQHPEYKYYQDYFLAHSPRSLKEKHYTMPSDEEFFDALEWLRKEILSEAIQ